MQSTGSSPCASAAASLRASASSVSPKSARRSEWPSRTPVAPASISMRHEISPVNAPSGASWTFWPHTPTPIVADALGHEVERRERRAEREVDLVEVVDERQQGAAEVGRLARAS